MLTPRCLFPLALTLWLAAEFPVSSAWTFRTAAKPPISSHWQITNPRTLPFFEVPRHERRSVPSLQSPGIISGNDRLRKCRLGSVALLAIVGLLLSPRSAVANLVATTTEAVAEYSAVASTTAMTLRLLPSPVPPMLELQLTLRLIFASVLGACVGKERSMTHKHSAGVRTMALVSLGAAAFTVCSCFGFTALAGGRCDPSRMASNVASGVGFVGAGVITTSTGVNPNDSRQSVVHGLTTATAIWISAAIGVACGVGMFYIATAATLSTISILKFGGFKPEYRGVKKGQKASSQLRLQRQSSGDMDALKNVSDERNSRTGRSSKEGSLVTTTAVSLEEMNRQGVWNYHLEDVEVDKHVAEFHQVGQADILEKAQAAARVSNTLTGLPNKLRNTGEELESYKGTADEYLRRLPEQPVAVRTTSSDFSNRGNETLGP